MQSAAIDLQRVADLFARTERVAGSAFLRREVAARMHERLDVIKLQPETMLDAGCGDGADLLLLQQRFPQAKAIGIDLSAAQIALAEAAQQQTRSNLQRVLGKWLPRLGGQPSTQLQCADFARLPVADAELDLLWSNLALHWHPQPDQVLIDWRRSLRANGLLMFSCFGPNTMRQLREALQAAQIDGARVLPFVDMHDLGDMLVDAGFATPVMDMEMITLTYNDVANLWRDLRAFGGNPMADQPRGMLGRAAFTRLQQALPRDTNGKICLDLEIIYGHAFRPVARKTASGEAIIAFQKMPRNT